MNAKSSTYLVRLTLFLISLSAWQNNAHAFMGASEIEKRNPTDISIKIGAYSGTIVRKSQKQNESDRTFQYGGVPFSVAIHNNYSSIATAFFQVGIVTDISNDQVTRQGFDGGIALHLFGGSKVIANEGKFASRIWRNSYNVSLLGTTGLHNYAASSPEDTSISVAGGVFEMGAGLQYRQDFGENSFGFDVLTTLFSVPASVERLETQGTEFSLFWRFLI